MWLAPKVGVHAKWACMQLGGWYTWHIHVLGVLTVRMHVACLLFIRMDAGRADVMIDCDARMPYVLCGIH